MKPTEAPPSPASRSSAARPARSAAVGLAARGSMTGVTGRSDGDFAAQIKHGPAGKADTVAGEFAPEFTAARRQLAGMKLGAAEPRRPVRREGAVRGARGRVLGRVHARRKKSG